jgi:hypothetical protein
LVRSSQPSSLENRNKQVRSAQQSAYIDTIFEGRTVFILNSNAYFCRGEGGWKRVRLARTRLLAGRGL